ncbi:apoptosis-associated speck-like protein containing a CARD [Chroicocephalus ridibundus]|uniref:apoptosis-associated speck-like protein containing a CARD n=1 Tax=Chroicocephalus ridibundus TaxID=1192867 RepID=UPI002FDEF18C
MEGADALDLAHLIVGHYGEGFGLRATAQALRRSQRRDLAEALVGEDAPRPSPPADLPRDVAAPPPPPAELFVRRHRLLLTQRVTGVGALLDHLEAAEVLTTEGVAEVAAASTPQERMRRLLATAPSWGRRGHEEFLKALRLLHPLLMEELEGDEDLQWSSPNP